MKNVMTATVTTSTSQAMDQVGGYFLTLKTRAGMKAYYGSRSDMEIRIAAARKACAEVGAVLELHIESTAWKKNEERAGK